ncbi:MAG: PQQ-binding-like beta-propeller repeat protein [Pseudomonadota bacterium]
MTVVSVSKFLCAAAVLALTACGDKDVILTGERENIRSVLSEEDIQAQALQAETGTVPPLKLPATRANPNWTQGIASSITRVAHPQLSAAPRVIWSTDIGQGDGRKNRITADPVVADGRVFTLDSSATVTALSTVGEVLWRRDLTPVNESEKDASGGGLAYADGELYVSTGFGILTAIEASSGVTRWEQNLRATSSGSPTVAGDLVYVVAGDNLAWALERSDGRIRWQLAASPDIRNVLGAPSPAVSEEFVIFAFGSGEVQGAFRKGGLRRWDAQVAGRRVGFATGLIDDITGDPVIDAGRVYVGNHSGSTVALNLNNGERLWTAPDGAFNPIWPAGDSIFMVTDRNELLRLSAEDGRRIWARTLPFFTKNKPRRQNEIFAHHGPIVAGGRLILASNDGLLRFYDPTTGAPMGESELPGDITTNPVVAGGTLYLVTTKGQLLALR